MHVGDGSNLTLDPDLDSYYLMDSIQFRAPALMDTVSRIAASWHQGPDQPAKQQEHNRWQVGTEHRESLYHWDAVVCNNVLLSAKCGYLKGDPGI